MNKIIEYYIKEVKELDIVKDVFIQQGPPMIITTVIEAPPFETKYREPIYDLQLKALRRMPTNSVPDFRVHNLLEEK